MAPSGIRERLRDKYPHHAWDIHFQFDQAMDGRTLKSLNVIDDYSGDSSWQMLLRC